MASSNEKQSQRSGIQFMVLGAPRSGTAWAANWLTTDSTFCLNDPLCKHHYSELDEIETPKRLGIACTSSALFSDWVLKHPARKVILHRDLEEVDHSLTRIGMPTLPPIWRRGVLDRIEGLHVHWTDLFEQPKKIWSYLLPDLPFDEDRHALLRELDVQVRYEGVEVDPHTMRRLMGELKTIMQELA